MAEREIKVENRKQDSSHNWAPVKNDGQPKNSDEIEHDIDQTRDEMDKLMDALAYRLNPKRIVNDYKDKSRKAYNNNKLPLVLAASGVVWMLWEIQKQDGKQQRIPVYEKEPIRYSKTESVSQGMESDKESFQQKTKTGIESARQKYQSGTETVQRKTEEGMEQAKQRFESGKERLGKQAEKYQARFQEKAESVKESFEQKRESAREKGEQFQEKTHDLTEQTKERSRETMNRAKEFIHDNPLLSGLSAMFAGMIAGLLLPETGAEKRALGKSSHNLLEKAKESTEHTLEKGKRVAEEAVHSFKEESGKQGLTSEQIKKEAKEPSEKPHEKVEKMGEKITTAAKKATEKADATIKQEQQGGRKAA